MTVTDLFRSFAEAYRASVPAPDRAEILLVLDDRLPPEVDTAVGPLPIKPTLATRVATRVATVGCAAMVRGTTMEAAMQDDSDDTGGTVLPPGTPCITRPAPGMDLLQVAMRHPGLGWVAVELDRGAASKLAQELQAFADFRSTGDGDA